ncbi:MAG: ferrous iron transport protein A [Anaerolineales bacterium]
MQAALLSELKTGQTGRILKLAAKGADRQRLLVMGLVRGERIEVVRVAPLGDPVEYQIKGYRLSLRKREAQLVLVEVQ